jgi:hypothetical protein
LLALPARQMHHFRTDVGGDREFTERLVSQR